MATVCILVPNLAMADAIGHDVAGMFTALQDTGVDVHILAEVWEPSVTLPVEPFDRWHGTYAGRADVIHIYHHSTSWESAYRRFLEARGLKVLRYHNVTPPIFFEPYSAEMAEVTRMAHAQTAILARSGCIDLFLGDSHYNTKELKALGAPASRCRVLPPFHKLLELSDVQASVPLLERYLDGIYNVLFLGRIVPNKGHRHLLGVVATFRQLFHHQLRLFLVGDLDHRFRAYHQELHALAHGLRVADAVIWTGKVGLEELKAYFLLAHVFLVMSEHEGFCVPAVEAMAHSIPIVAYAAGPIPETVGDGGIVLEGLDYGDYAAALELLFTRNDVRDAILKRQQDRIASDFAPPVLSRRFWELLTPLLS